VGVYASAGFPNYPKADIQGYPNEIDVSKRLAFFTAITRIIMRRYTLS
jgi:alkaline phosphatase